MGAILNTAELADEWMVGRRDVVRHQLFEKTIDQQHACALFCSIAIAIEQKYGEEPAAQFVKAFAAH